MDFSQCIQPLRIMTCGLGLQTCLRGTPDVPSTIRSHQDYSDADAWLQWACSANDFADCMAAWALTQLPEDVISLQALAKRKYEQMQQMTREVHEHFVRVAHFAVDSPDNKTPAPAKPIDHLQIMSWKDIARIAPDKLPHRLTFVGMHKVYQWCQWIHEENRSPSWVSWFEMLFSFQIYTGEWGIQSTSAHNTWQLHDQMTEYDPKQACRSLSSFLIQLIRLILPDYKAERNRPSNNLFRCWAMGTFMQFSRPAEAAVHNWMERTFQGTPIHKVSGLCRAPGAARSLTGYTVFGSQGRRETRPY